MQDKSVNLKSNDTFKYNLRCNRNISEKMTKKDFIYDIPTPFQAVRKEKCLAPGVVKKSRLDNFTGCLMTSNSITTSQAKAVARGESKLNKNPIGLLRLIHHRQPQNFSITGGKSSSMQSGEERKRSESEKEIRRQIVLPIQIRKKIGTDSKPPRYAVIPTNKEDQREFPNPNHKIEYLHQFPERKILRYQCNYCQERMATLLSLSTHVKYHCEAHCTICYWILQPDESMTQHIERAHPVNVPAPVLIPKHP